MPNVKKLIEKMKQQPSGIRPEEAEKVLAAYGYVPVRQKGSHKHLILLSCYSMKKQKGAGKKWRLKTI